MKITENKPPRIFQVGFDHEKIDIADCGAIELAANEQVTFHTPAGGEYDVARKDFGFYATPSVNGRLKRFNFKTALVKNRIDQFFILLVEEGKEALFFDYIAKDRQELVCWLDQEANLEKIAAIFTPGTDANR